MATISKGKRPNARSSNKKAQGDREHLALAKYLAKAEAVVVANPSLNRFAVLTVEGEENDSDTPRAPSFRPTLSRTLEEVNASLKRLINQDRRRFQKRTECLVREKDAKIQELTCELSRLHRHCNMVRRDTEVMVRDFDDLQTGVDEELLPHIEKLEDDLQQLQHHTEWLAGYGAGSYARLNDWKAKFEHTQAALRSKCEDHRIMLGRCTYQEGVIISQYRTIHQRTVQLESAASAVGEQLSRANAAEQVVAAKDEEIRLLKQQLEAKDKVIEQNDLKIKKQDEVIREAYSSEEGKFNVWHSRNCPTEERIRLALSSSARV